MIANRSALLCAALITTLMASFHSAIALQPENEIQSARDFLNAEAGNQNSAARPNLNSNTKLAALPNNLFQFPQAAPDGRAENPAQPAANAHVASMIDRHAASAGVPAAFARTVVRIESNYNPRATGRAGEVGLMQIKYQTARGIGFTGTRAQLYDPDTNLLWGMKYLAIAYRLGGNTDCGAVLRYQAGHGATRATGASQAYCAKVRRHMASN